MNHPFPMPSEDEILTGATQGGVARPSFDFDEIATPQPVRLSFWARLLARLRKVA